jgi:hypothetical protein
MRRSIEFCRWQADWWKEQKEARTNIPTHIAEGIRAYAIEHEATERRRSIEWTAKWMQIRKRAEDVLSAHLGDKDSSTPLPNLSIDIDEDSEIYPDTYT